MNKKFALFLASFTLICAAKASATANTNTDLESKFALLMERTQQLENEVRSLRSELHSTKSITEQLTQSETETHVEKQEQLAKAGNYQVRSLHTPEYQAGDSEAIIASGGQSLIYLAGAPVISSPFLGIRSAFDDNDLLIRLGGINFDLQLLEQRAKLERAMIDADVPIPDHPVIELSGRVTGVAGLEKPLGGDPRSSLSIALVDFAVIGEVNDWITAAFNIQYAGGVPGIRTGNGMVNRRLYVEKALMTLGNLNRSPFYATFARSYVPFGEYDSEMISGSLAEVIGRIWTEYVQLGFTQGDNGFSGSIFAFKPKTTASDNRLAGGANIAYRINNEKFTGKTNLSFVTNVAEAYGYQFTGSDGFAGFGVTPGAQLINHFVPAVAFRTEGRIGKIGYGFEGVVPTRSFDSRDLSHKSPHGTLKGAKPMAFVLEGSYNFEAFNSPWAFALGYATSREAYVLGLPKHRYSAVIKTALWRDTRQSLEFRHEKNYAAGTAGCGRGVLIPTFDGTLVNHDFGCIPVPASEGGNSNAVIFRFDTYF